MDSTLTTGLLTRLDAITNKMGVAATEVWSVWLATSWRPALNLAVLGVVALVSFLLGTKSVRYALSDECSADEEPLFGMAGIILCAVCLFTGIGFMVNFADAIVYLNEPRLYALDQLRGLVGK
jgi:hypothetical protein